MKIEDSGERVIPDFMKPTNGLLLEHIARYQFSTHYLKGRVLDLASGSGFGSQMLAKLGKKRIETIVAVDCDPSTVAYAKGRYNHPLVEYRCENAVDPLLPQKLGLFDVIVSFETIEHIEEEQQFLSNVYQLLKPGGVLILSTPFGKGRGKPCGSAFHVHQLTVDEFKNLFNGYTNVKFYGQKGVLIEPTQYDENWYPIGITVCTK
ncbi:Methyltransferase domain-containing protein [Mesobacillus persicus]|uniref:Methyltransferase domain-containing protein n=1 Tax=Mesobacillus persicus TaxID=930146 RepID=A0A1H8JJ99_9BACI|nr:class I SAM-dependent methyltransferase [Mesobacillus persicus]SEN80839.1 Methyltransferase domain-containing protein [Mesobacillus persicus]